ncbi:MAG: HPr family phosphocarrier protein [Clostridia bacterium]|nr:HPr family phosphocarrier protein [Clostridia bacterium]
MKQFTYVLTKPHALHAKTVGNLMREASRFESIVHLSLEEKRVALKDARLLMGAGNGEAIVVSVEGKDEEAAVAAFQSYFVANL